MIPDPNLDEQPTADETLPPPPPPRRGGIAVIFVAAGVVAAALVFVIFYVGGVIPHGGVKKETAERVCRTAFGSEWQARSKQAAGGSDTTVIGTVKSIEMQEVWKVADGWSVNGTVHYTLTTALIAPVEGSIDLTCTATGKDDSPTTAVTNRS